MGEFFPGQRRSADCVRFTRHRTETERENGRVQLTWPWAPGELTELTVSRRNRSAEQNANLQPLTGHPLHGCVPILPSSPLRFCQRDVYSVSFRSRSPLPWDHFFLRFKVRLH